jgi:hypothetical protein
MATKAAFRLIKNVKLSPNVGNGCPSKTHLIDEQSNTNGFKMNKNLLKLATKKDRNEEITFPAIFVKHLRFC